MSPFSIFSSFQIVFEGQTFQTFFLSFLCEGILKKTSLCNGGGWDLHSISCLTLKVFLILGNSDSGNYIT